MLGGPEIGGRIFYNEDLSGFNFASVHTRLDQVLMELADVWVDDRDLGCPVEVRQQQGVVGDAALVLLELTMAHEQRLRLRGACGATATSSSTAVDRTKPARRVSPAH